MPSNIDADGNLLVATSYDSEADFSGYTTFSVADSIFIIDSYMRGQLVKNAFLTSFCLTVPILNLFFVICFHMDVAGVALATVISECISALLVCRCLTRTEGSYRLIPSQLRIHPRALKRIAKIGLPAGFQGAVFSISNVLIQSSINSFGSVAMAGSTASANLEGFVYNAMNALYQTNLSFTSQNLGGGKYSRLNRVLILCLTVVTVVGAVMGGGFVLAGHQLLRIYSSDPEVIQYGFMRLTIVCGTYFLCGWMDVLVGSMRGMGYSIDLGLELVRILADEETAAALKKKIQYER